ncbi:MAG: ribosome silencing factor [Pseudomonadota bacterium]
MSFEMLKQIAINALEEMKALDVVEIDVTGKSSVTDCMIVASGTSNRHVKSCADTVVEDVKKNGIVPISIEGREESQWVLVDLGDVVVHVFQEETRALYAIEDLWRIEREPSGDAE